MEGRRGGGAYSNYGHGGNGDGSVGRGRARNQQDQGNQGGQYQHRGIGGGRGSGIHYVGSDFANRPPIPPPAAGCGGGAAAVEPTAGGSFWTGRPWGPSASSTPSSSTGQQLQQHLKNPERPHQSTSVVLSQNLELFVTEKSDVSKPITTVLIGSNYNLWVQGMKSFLIGRKFWRIVTGDITKPTREPNETDAKFVDRLEDWDSKNHQIITWFCNTSIPSIHIQFADYDSAKEIWDFLATRYQTTRLAHYYQLWTTLHSLKQESGQSVNDFLIQVQPIWNQISQAKISEDHIHLIQVLMALRPEYEAVRASLLHQNPLPTLDTVVQEIMFEETRLNLDKTSQSEVVLATTRFSYKKSSNQLCKNCYQTGHVFANCPTGECRYCHEFGHIIENCPTRPPKPKRNVSKSKNVSKIESSLVTAVATTEGSTTITISDLEALLKQV